MSDEDEVDWQRLPHDPQAFFGLPEKYDRRHLKRAYGKLIRQFKPETHPEEFQRIRAAYEELETYLRYGETRQQAFNANQEWDIQSHRPATERRSASSQSDRQQKNADHPPPQTVIELAISDAETTFRSLSAKAERTPQEHYVVAVLSDLVERQSGHTKFLDYLLAGLSDHPEDPGLQGLVQQYLRSDVSLQMAPAILEQVAATTRSPSFYRITESLWERLLREQDFAFFRELLTRCESKIQQTESTSRNVFYVRILRTAVWKAPAEWINKRIDELESQASRLEPFLLQELEFVAMLRDHLMGTSLALRNYEARSRLERFLYLYCTSDGPTATAEMTAELSQIARDAASVRAAFPILNDRDETPLYMLTYLATDDLQQTTGLGFGEINENQNNVLARALLEDLKPTQQTIVNTMNTLSFQYRWLPFIVGIMLSVVLVPIFLSIEFSTTRSSSPVPSIIGICIPIAFIVSYFVWLYPKYLEPRLDRAQGETWWQLYEQHWRERIFRYVQSCNEPPTDAFERVASIGRLRQQDDWAGLVQRFAINDIGLLIFSQTQAFVV